jgi:hypothetical protein
MTNRPWQASTRSSHLPRGGIISGRRGLAELTGGRHARTRRYTQGHSDDGEHTRD